MSPLNAQQKENYLKSNQNKLSKGTRDISNYEEFKKTLDEFSKNEGKTNLDAIIRIANTSINHFKKVENN